MTNMRSILLASAALVITGFSSQAADQLLSGAITSATGEKLGGVTVPPRLDGSTTTPWVNTDESGAFYFPPMAAGKYKVWAQALGFETTKSEVDLSAAKRQNLTLTAMTDPEQRW